jgi:ribosomal protein S18 acetylase RimI-like enzyme
MTNNDNPNITFSYVQSGEDIDQIKLLFREYEKAIGVDLCFQNFEKELADLPGQYALPEGCLILARVDNQMAGCVALRRFEANVCEMKRLYLRSQFRKLGLGRQMATIIIKEAVNRGYKTMRLDTLPSMTEAIALYKSMGFVQIDSYRYNPLEGAIYMEKQL